MLHPLFANILAPIAPPQSQLASSISDRNKQNQQLKVGMGIASHGGMKQRRLFNRTCRLVEYHGNNRATFECSEAGHRFKSNMVKRAPNGKLPSEEMLRKMAHWWSNKVYAECPECAASRR
jgi:hypothetical protein